MNVPTPKTSTTYSDKQHVYYYCQQCNTTLQGEGSFKEEKPDILPTSMKIAEITNITQHNNILDLKAKVHFMTNSQILKTNNMNLI